MSQYIAEVIDLHTLIEALFARGEGSSTALMEHFDPSFTMVTTAGAAISLEQVSALFENQTGKQPGLQIEVSKVEVLAEWETGATVSYRETHITAGQTPRSRFSTALFSLVNGKPVWRHLQETVCSKQDPNANQLADAGVVMAAASGARRWEDESPQGRD